VAAPTKNTQQPAKRVSSDEATALRRTVRKDFIPSDAGDKMILLVEEYDPPEHKGVQFFVQCRPSLVPSSSGGRRVALSFVILGEGPGGKLPPEGIPLPTGAHAAMKAGESLIVHAMLDPAIMTAISRIAPALAASYQQELLKIVTEKKEQAEPATGVRKPRV
jgi:hypothetical protein